jgi:hypothetical protein
MVKATLKFQESTKIKRSEEDRYLDPNYFNYSIFRLMINTNKSAHGSKKEHKILAQQLKGFLQDLQKNIMSYLILSHFDVKKRDEILARAISIDKNKIKTIKIDATLEVGQLLHRIHLDGFVSIKHQTCIHLEGEKVKVLARAHGLPSISIRGSKDVAKYIKQYSHKQI